MVIEVGKLAGNAIIPYSQATKRTKQITLTVTGTNWTTTTAVGMFYSDSNDIWRLKFNIRGTLSSTTSSLLDLGITGVTTAAVTQSVYSRIRESGVATRTPFNEAIYNSIMSVSGDGNFDDIAISGDIELSAEPTAYTTAANMESSVDASIYVESASASQAGLVDTAAQSFDGLKNFTGGINVTSVSGSFYQTDDVELDSGFTGGELTVRCTKIGNMVTITCLGVPTHSSASSVSSSGIIPAAYRPSVTTYTVYLFNASGNAYRVGVTSTGALSIVYYNYDGTLVNLTNTSTPPTISYNV